MLTIFAIPKAFEGKFKLIQLNALRSWLQLNNKIEIILLGNEKGIDSVVKEYKLGHIPLIKKNNLNTPLLNDCFSKVRKKAHFNLLCYVNADIILLSDFLRTIKKIKLPQFLLTGRRYCIEIAKEISFQKYWEKELKKDLKKRGYLDKPGALDYFVFTKRVNLDMLPFAVGRTAWDNWIVYKTRLLNIPVIDASKVIWAIHQKHDYSHAGGYDKIWHGKERDYNWKLVGDRRKFFNIQDANYLVDKKGVVKIPLSRERIIRSIEKFPVLHSRIGFLAEPLIFLIRIFKYLLR